MQIADGDFDLDTSSTQQTSQVVSLTEFPARSVNNNIRSLLASNLIDTLRAPLLFHRVTLLCLQSRRV